MLVLSCALPIGAQLTVQCPAPAAGQPQLATLTWSDPAHPVVTARIEQNPDHRHAPQNYPGIGLVQSKQPTAAGTATLAAQPGTWDAYIFQDSPYWQSDAVYFTCDAAAAPAATDGPVATIGNVDFTSGFESLALPGHNIQLMVDLTRTLVRANAPPPDHGGECSLMLGSQIYWADETHFYLCVQNTAGGFHWARGALETVW